MQIITFDTGKYSAGVFVFTGEKSASYTIKNKSKIQEEAIFTMVESVSEILCRHFDRREKILAIIEGYGNSPKNKRSVRINAEIVGAVKYLFYLWNAQVLIMPVQTWKSLTIGRIDKKDENNYMQVIKNIYGKSFESTDEADAFLFYQALVALGNKTANLTPAQTELRRQAAEYLEELKEG